ncbi:MAG: hypothetical protein IKY71_05005 [Bacteroidaceae bacterium]|nr:hypothetical protein [Bacteroidaceae bacterium]
MRRFIIILMTMLVCSVALFAAEQSDLRIHEFMKQVAGNVAADSAGVESLSARLYMRERVDVARKNWLLNIIPSMTHFDRDENEYVAELFYYVNCMYNSLPEIRRVASHSTFERSSGEMDKVLFFMTPQIFGEKLFDSKHLSPLYPSNLDYYNYSVDSLQASKGLLYVGFESRFDNIQLFNKGWFAVRLDDMLPAILFVQGWDEECEFSVECRLGENGLERYVVKGVDLHIDYAFALNRLAVDVAANFDYLSLQERRPLSNLDRGYNLTLSKDRLSGVRFDSAKEFADRHRHWPLSQADSLLYIKKGINLHGERKLEPLIREGDVKNMLWALGDKAISSHSLAWGSSDLVIPPVLNPSCLSYSTSRGLAYKLSFRFRKQLSRERRFGMRPMIGYNFKKHEFYWGLEGFLEVNPLKRSALVFDIGRGSSLYSCIMLDEIEKAAVDTMNISSRPFVYYRDFHIKGNWQFEIANGLELQMGTNYYRRTMSGSALGLEVNGVLLKKNYNQLAPHLRLTWHPGMYYYIDNGRKVNLGSRMPRFVLDVEQGMSRVLGSNGIYTRVELDMQYMHSLPSNASLYMRLGTGGYFYTKDLYFVNYAFLKNNDLPLDKDDELSGAFQLLDSEWYNSANKYVRASFTYEAPFLFMQKMVPSVSFIKSEALYSNILFISSLRPYIECGYGVDTPYVNAGLFISFENYTYHALGFKAVFSLFRN